MQNYSTPTNIGDPRWGVPADYHNTAAPSPAFASEKLAPLAYANTRAQNQGRNVPIRNSRYVSTYPFTNLEADEDITKRGAFSFLTDKVAVTNPKTVDGVVKKPFEVPVWGIIAVGAGLLFGAMYLFPKIRNQIVTSTKKTKYASSRDTGRYASSSDHEHLGW